MTEDTALKFRSGELTLSDWEGWTDEIRTELERNEFNGNVGTKLLLENDRLRVWEIPLGLGERLSPHRHVLDYFWTAVTSGRFLQRSYDGTSWGNDYDAGLTFYADVEEGEFAWHDLENHGPGDMIFTTVEFKNGANEPLGI